MYKTIITKPQQIEEHCSKLMTAYLINAVWNKHIQWLRNGFPKIQEINALIDDKSSEIAESSLSQNSILGKSASSACVLGCVPPPKKKMRL